MPNDTTIRVKVDLTFKSDLVGVASYIGKLRLAIAGLELPESTSSIVAETITAFESDNLSL